MFPAYLYTIAALALSLAPAAAKSKGDSYHFLNGGKFASPSTAAMQESSDNAETCQGGFTPQIQHFPLNSRACLDASTVTSIYIDGATGKTCSYWSEESDCLGKTVTIEHTKKGGEANSGPYQHLRADDLRLL
jgi:hypothetical protein